MKKQVQHKQIYKPTIFCSGQINTTLCGRVRNQADYNVAETDAGVTCKFCRKILDRSKQ